MYDRNNQLVFFFYRNHPQEPVRYSNQSCQLLRDHVWIDHTWHFTFELRRKMLTRRHRKIILYLDSFEDAQTNVFLFFCLLTIERYVTFIWNIFQVIDICILPLYLFCISAFGRLKGKIKKNDPIALLLVQSIMLGWHDFSSLFRCLFLIDLRLSCLHNKTNFILSSVWEELPPETQWHVYGWHHQWLV